MTRKLLPLQCEWCANWSLCQFGYTDTDTLPHVFCCTNCLLWWVEQHRYSELRQATETKTRQNKTG